MADESLEQHQLQELRRRAILEIRANPPAYAERLRARGATEEQVAGILGNVGVDYSQALQPTQGPFAEQAPTPGYMAMAPTRTEQPPVQPGATDQDVLVGATHVRPQTGTTV